VVFIRGLSLFPAAFPAWAVGVEDLILRFTGTLPCSTASAYCHQDCIS
jgi:hypothetical protein